MAAAQTRARMEHLRSIKLLPNHHCEPRTIFGGGSPNKTHQTASIIKTPLEDG
jgi:hypothetical protein